MNKLHGKALRENRERDTSSALCKFIEIIILACALVFLVAFTSYAGEACQAQMTADIAEQVVILAAFAVIDYGQSVDLFFHQAGYYEVNPVLGKYPSRRDIAAFGIAGVALTWTIGQIDHPLARIAVDSIVSSEQFNVQENARLVAGRKRVISGIPIIVTWRF